MRKKYIDGRIKVTLIEFEVKNEIEDVFEKLKLIQL